MKKLYQSLLLLFLFSISINFEKSYAQVAQCILDDKFCNFGDPSTSSGQSGIDPTTGVNYLNNCYNTGETKTGYGKKVFCLPPTDYSNGTRLVCDKAGAEKINLTYRNILTKSGTFPDYIYKVNETNISFYCSRCTDSNMSTWDCPVPNKYVAPGGGGGGTGGGSTTDTPCRMEAGMVKDSQGNECIFGTGNSTCYKTGTQFSKVFGAVSRNFFCNGMNKQVNCPTSITNYADVFTTSEALITKPGNGCEVGADFNPPITGLNACNKEHDKWLIYELDGPPYWVAYTPAQELNFKKNYIDCLKQNKSKQECLNISFGGGPRDTIDEKKISRCICEIPFNLNCLTGIFCDVVCSRYAAGFTNVAVPKTVSTSSPMLIIKVFSNTLFYAAIFLFVINFIYQGYRYTRSAGKEEELKGAQQGLTNNIMGLVFVLLIGSLLSYIISILVGAGL